MSGLSPSKGDVGVNYFLHHFINNGRGCLNYIPASSYCAEASHPLLTSSMAAVGLMALAKSAQHSELVHPAHAKYAEAVRMVNAALAVKCTDDRVLMSVVSLGVFEEVSDYKSWLLHIQGAAALIVARGQTQFSSSIAYRLFNQVRSDLITASINNNRPIPEAFIRLQETVDQSKKMPTFWRIGVLGTQCASLLADFKTRSTLKAVLLQRATMLQHDFEKLLPLLFAEEPYVTVQEPTADRTLVWNNRVDLYQDVGSIRLWNNWRNLLMIVCRVRCALLQEVLVSEPVFEVQCRLHETMNLLASLGDGILASFSQAMAFRPPGIHCNVSGGYLLAPRLAVVGQSPTTSWEARRWIIQRLHDISRNTGIPMASQIMGQLQVLKELPSAHS